MATKHIQAYAKSRDARPGLRAARARKMASKILIVFSAVSMIAVALMFAKMQIPGLDVPGLAWSGY